MTTNKHGGPGRGQGRKRKYTELVRHTVTLLPEHAEWLRKLGNGKLSEGIRILTEKHLDE